MSALRKFPSPPAALPVQPINEAARTAARDALDLAETNSSVGLDRLANLAAKMLGVPMTAVTLVGADGEVVIGQFGFVDVEVGVPIAVDGFSFCHEVAKTRRRLAIPDARVDPLSADCPVIEQYGVVGYLGVPLIDERGEVLGAFCAIDSRPHGWSEEDVAALTDFATAAAEILNGRSELVHHGLHDRLTGLPNRELLVASCDDFIARLGEGENVAVLCAGLDHFNMVNQAFGSEKGDRVLCAVAERLVGAVRAGDVFGRLRGDLFAMVAPGIRDEAEALSLAARFHRVLSATPIEIEGRRISLGATLGIALGGRGSNGSDLISDAANAMREAKRSQGRVRVAERAHAENAAAHLRMREALHVACEHDEIDAVFQPIVALDGNRVAGFETLARWDSATVGKVSPADFIPLAELTSDIVRIGEVMINRAAAFAADLHEKVGEEVRVTLNASPVQLDRPGFAAMVRAAFEAQGLTGRSVGIEITEGTLLESGVLERSNLNLLREFGARVLLDDFGTGYSSLAYLRDFQIDTIKIDRSFVDRMPDERHSAALIQAIIAMARGMEMEVVAEGVETEEQAKLLRLLGCRYGQGFGLGRPVSAGVALAAMSPADRDFRRR